MKSKAIKREGVIRESFDYVKAYNIETTQKITSEGKESTCVVKMNVTKTFIEKNELGLLYKIVVSDRVQSNKESLRGVENFLAPLQNVLMIYTDEMGYVKSIANLEKVKEKWIDKRGTFINRFRHINDLEEMTNRLDELMNNKDGFTNIFKQSDIGTLLFPPVYTEELSEETKVLQWKYFYNFFGTYALPLYIETELIENKEENSTVTKVARIGMLDPEHFEEDEVKAMFREGYNTDDLNDDVGVNYAELYDLNRDSTIDKALQIFFVAVGNKYIFDQMTKVKTI